MIIKFYYNLKKFYEKIINNKNRFQIPFLISMSKTISQQKKKLKDKAKLSLISSSFERFLLNWKFIGKNTVTIKKTIKIYSAV